MSHNKNFVARVPGSVMVLGEHAVLHGGQAVVFAVDQHMLVTLTPRDDSQIIIHSALGELHLSIDRIVIQEPFEFVLCAIQNVQGLLKAGFELNIESQFSSLLGLGSSAAVTVATLSVLYQWLDVGMETPTLFQQALAVIHHVQGAASGADVAASICGGVVAYQRGKMQRIADTLPVGLWYSGSKVPTKIVLEHIRKHFAQDPNGLNTLYRKIDHCAAEGIKMIESKDWFGLGKIMKEQQKLMQDLGVNVPKLAQMVQQLNQQKAVYGVKISGAGMGDCVIALADAEFLKTHKAHNYIPINVDNKGIQVTYE